MWLVTQKQIACLTKCCCATAIQKLEKVSMQNQAHRIKVRNSLQEEVPDNEPNYQLHRFVLYVYCQHTIICSMCLINVPGKLMISTHWSCLPIAMSFMPGQPNPCKWKSGILAGKDLQDGGTWMGVAPDGRFAALTNYRDPAMMRTDRPSRGQIVRQFLEEMSVSELHLWLENMVQTIMDSTCCMATWTHYIITLLSGMKE